MLLRQIGNKAKIASKIYSYFPHHETRVILFFGASSDYFNMPRPKECFANDYDSNVYNCFDVLMRRKSELVEYIEMIPYSMDFWNECKKRQPTTEIENVVYFLILSNFGYMGKPDTLSLKQQTNSKRELLQNIEKTYKELVSTKNKISFLNVDFRDVMKKISWKNSNVFIYSDPPYFETTNNYNMAAEWNEQDIKDCFDVTFNSGFKAAMSEFNHPFIIEQAKQRGLNIIEIGERRSMKNRSVEILITNYETNKNLFN